MSKFHFLIVTPSYNQARFIKKTIDSILGQKGNFSVTYHVQDGKSTDGTQEVLKNYSKQLTWQSKKDRGQTNAINIGVKTLSKSAKDKSTNYIFAYLNSDDYYLPGALEGVAEAFANNPDKYWLVGDAVIVDEKGTEIQRYVRLYKNFWRWLLSWPLLMVMNPLPQPATFIRWEAVQEIGDFNEQSFWVMDYQYWLELWQKYGPPIKLNQTLAAFRIHGQSKSSGFQKQFIEQYNMTKNYTRNGFLLGLQKLHNKLITGAYSLLK